MQRIYKEITVISIVETITAIEVRYRIFGNLRFLSHIETMRMLERALVRAGIGAVYSEGFNPHIRLSLPLARPVGVEGQDELMCLYVKGAAGDFDAEGFKRALEEELAEGVEILSVEPRAGGKYKSATGAAYIFPLVRDIVEDEKKTGGIRERAEQILSQESIQIERQVFKGRKRRKEIDARSFLESIRLVESELEVKIRISEEGTIRIEEIMELLGLRAENIEGAIRRIRVEWRN